MGFGGGVWWALIVRNVVGDLFEESGGGGARTGRGVGAEEAGGNGRVRRGKKGGDEVF